MKYFKNENDQVFAYESDGSQDSYIKPELISITEEEALELANPSRGATIPQQVTRRQGRLALLETQTDDTNYLVLVEAAISSMSDPLEQMKAQVEYEADTWERDNAFLQSMWAQLGGTEAELDDLFIAASQK